jgi:hypothetical protein
MPKREISFVQPNLNMGGKRLGNRAMPQGSPEVDPATLPKQLADKSKFGNKIRHKTSERRPSSRSTYETEFENKGNKFSVSNTWINYSNGYQVYNEESARVDFEGRNSDTLYENPYQIQEAPSLNQPTTGRTLTNIVRLDHILPIVNESNSKWVYEALSDIHAIQRKEINKTTGGGTAASNSVFNLDTWLKYHNRYTSLFAYAIELASRQAWSSQVPKSNLVLRDIATACALTNTLELRNKMARRLSQAALPEKLVRYLTWYFQVYKSNNHDYSIDQFFSSREFASAFCTNDASGDDYTAYESKIDSLVSHVNESYDAASAKFPQITALIEEKTSQPYVNLRNATIPSNTTGYDADWNDIFNLQPSLVVTSGVIANQVHVPPRAAAGSYCPAAFRRDKDNVPNHVIASLGPNQTIADYNGFIHPAYRFDSGHSSQMSSGNTNKFTLFSDSSSVTNVNARTRHNNISTSFQGNDFANVFSLDAMVSYEYEMSPKGEASYLFEITEANTKMAARAFIFELFGIEH